VTPTLTITARTVAVRAVAIRGRWTFSTST
jgi:hypothetical protein